MQDHPHFIGRVETLRGLAALTVAIFHALRWFGAGGHDAVFTMHFRSIDGVHVAIARATIVIFNGNAAVSLFFVISGMVLGLSVLRNNRSWYEVALSFMARRAFRLYPPMLMNLLIIFAASWLAAAIAPRIYERPVLTDLLENLLYVEPALVSATWSLFIEMGMAPIFVVAALLVRQFGLRTFWLLGLLGIVSLFSDYGLPSWWTTWRIGNFFFMFVLGAALPSIGPRLVSGTSVRTAFTLLIISFLLLGSARGFFGWDSRWALFLEGTASALLVSLVTWGPPMRTLQFLEHRTLRTLGRISYSFYLYHPLTMGLVTPPFLLLVASTGLSATWPIGSGFLLAALTIPPALLLANWFYWRIEVPSMQAGTSFNPSSLFARKQGQPDDRS